MQKHKHKYVAQPGESLESISQQFNIPVDWLSKHNPEVRDVFLRFGRRRVVVVPIIIPPFYSPYYFPYPPFDPPFC